MTHCSDEELLLEYYGEASRHSAHRRACAECDARYQELRATLDSITLEPPERGEHYGLEVWQAIRHRLPLHYVTSGQRVPEDLFIPSADLMIERSLRGAAKPSAFALAEDELPLAIHGAVGVAHA